MRRAFCFVTVLLVGISTPALAQGIDRSSILKQNKAASVKVIVTGKDPAGRVVTRTGSGVIVRSSGTIATSKSLLGRDEEWFQIGGALERTIEVFAVDDHGVARSIGKASAKAAPPSDVVILQITGENFPYATLDETNLGDLPSAVSIIWEPDASGPDAVSGDLSYDPSRFGDLLVIRSQLLEGWEGAGVYGPSGRLVGIITKQIDKTRVAAEKIYAWASRLPPIKIARPSDVDLLACESAERARRVARQPFTSASSIRCQNMGDSQEGSVQYSAPPGFTIAGSVNKADETNYGTVGPVEYATDGSRVTVAKVGLNCSTPNRPFGPGGWAGSTLTGYIERILSENDLNQIRKDCLKAK